MIKIYGKNCIHEAIRANRGITQVYLTKEQATKDIKFTSLLKDKNISFLIVDKKKMDQLFGNGHQGYGAYREDYDLYDESIIFDIEGKNKRILVLDGIMDPHNLGAIIRSVDAFGYDAIILPKNRSCSITETVAHVSTGAIEWVKIAYVNSLPTLISKLKDNGFWICGTDASGKDLLSSIDLNRDLAVIIGSEGFGMSKTLLNLSDYVLQIPMCGHVNSLNASVSTGIVLSYLGK
ncbi:MAG: 23S rRNA (guanosine(2251)-2'-O)-methyltransferase RlmB [Anaeroplasmataceae bacterium]|nr:23S rRNA (guanosine(2251)-2'-O)-methyltransferase RlmB [Anaeroplasmataceae bacterium]